jgi:hypothetical protein
MRGAIPPLPQYAFMAWCSVKHKDNFTFTFINFKDYLALDMMEFVCNVNWDAVVTYLK